MKLKISVYASCLLFVILAGGCSTRVVQQNPSVEQTSNTQEFQVGQPSNPPRIALIKGDTLSYIVDFTNKAERDRFTLSLNEFLKNYPFATVKEDSTGHQVKISILPVKSEEKTDSMITSERSRFVGNIIEKAAGNTGNPEIKDTSVNLADTENTVPVSGGQARIYMRRSDIDQPFTSLVELFPLKENKDDTNGVLIVTDSSQRRIVLKIASRITNGNGLVISALDMIDTWSKFIKAHPGEGYALFRHVDGVIDFINGKEAIVRGFGVTDERTVQIRLAEPDSFAIERMHTGRLLGMLFRTGPYYFSEQKENTLTLLNNSHSGSRPFLDKVMLGTGDDPNPIISFSLNKYDAVTVCSKSDLDYARKNLSKTGALSELPAERYFLSVKLPDQAARDAFSALINPQDLLDNYVKAEGSIITAVTFDNPELQNAKQTFQSKGLFINGQFKILFRKDDPVSKSVAEKILADLTRKNISCVLLGSDVYNYEKTLVSGDYGCAVGWVPQSVFNDKSEQLRFFTLWFSDITDEQQVLNSKSEIPLFNVKRYILMKPYLHLYNNSLKGIYRK
jgi:hypothetical protein